MKITLPKNLVGTMLVSACCGKTGKKGRIFRIFTVVRRDLEKIPG